MSEISYRLIRSSRKTIAIQITPAGEVVVRCPRFMSGWAVRSFVRSREDWIRKQLEKQSPAREVPQLTEKEHKALAKEAAAWFAAKTAELAPVVGVSYGRITIRTQRTRWGSCSGKGNLNFNCLLMLAPEKVREYVVVHELCHRKEMNHSKAFWAQVERVMPDYKIHKKWLKDNGPALMARLEKTEEQ